MTSASHFGKGDCCVVLIGRTDDLHAYWQSARRSPHWGYRGGNPVKVAGDIQKNLIHVGSLALSRGDGGLVKGARVVRERRSEVYRAQEQVDVVEVVGPSGTSQHAPIVELDEPLVRDRRGVLREERMKLVCVMLLGGVHALGPSRDHRRPARSSTSTVSERSAKMSLTTGARS